MFRSRLVTHGLVAAAVLALVLTATVAQDPSGVVDAFAEAAESAEVAVPGQRVPVEQSPRNANYRIEAQLDANARTIEGRQVLTWRNIQQHSTAELRFHLYWNGFRNDRSTWMLGDRIRGRADLKVVREEDWGFTDVQSTKLLAGERGPAEAVIAYDDLDLSGTMRFDSPDDGNPHDRTVLVVDLPHEVAPGETIRVEMTWRSKVPRTFARTGFRGNFFFIAHWFPKLGVFEGPDWNCHQFHAGTEFFSDYGVYDVTLTVPRSHVLGATGRRIATTENNDDTVTHQHYQEDVHGFAWTSSPRYQELTQLFEAAGLPSVEMRLLIQPEHLGQAQRHFDATSAALEHYGKWYGAYPYGHITVIDPAYGSGAGGMEYPTLFTCGSRLFAPFGAGSPESVTVHEAGHQFWYGLVGNNEFEHAWIDEGFNTFSTIRTMRTVYGDSFVTRRFLRSPGKRGRGMLPLSFPDIREDAMISRLSRYRGSALSDDQGTDSWRYYPATGGNISYSKTALWLDTLERHLGWDVLQRAMSTFFDRYRYGHPTPEDFFAVLDEVAGEDLSWFMDQLFDESVAFDYAIASVLSRPAAPKGFVEGPAGLVYTKPGKDADNDDDEADADDATTVYRTEVVVQRRQSGVFPVDVLLVFEDGHELRERWDGVDHWKTIVVERPGKLRHAVVDPERVLMLDIDATNNSKLREAEATLPARKWASKWMIWLQDVMTTMAFFS